MPPPTPDEAILLTMRLHGQLLRLLATTGGVHYAGLTVAACHQRRRLGPALTKKLKQLDTTFSVLRHITAPSSDGLYAAVAEKLSTPTGPYMEVTPMAADGNNSNSSPPGPPHEHGLAADGRSCTEVNPMAADGNNSSSSPPGGGPLSEPACLPVGGSSSYSSPTGGGPLSAPSCLAASCGPPPRASPQLHPPPSDDGHLPMDCHEGPTALPSPIPGVFTPSSSTLAPKALQRRGAITELSAAELSALQAATAAVDANEEALKGVQRQRDLFATQLEEFKAQVARLMRAAMQESDPGRKQLLQQTANEAVAQLKTFRLQHEEALRDIADGTLSLATAHSLLDAQGP